LRIVPVISKEVLAPAAAGRGEMGSGDNTESTATGSAGDFNELSSGPGIADFFEMTNSTARKNADYAVMDMI